MPPRPLYSRFNEEADSSCAFGRLKEVGISAQKTHPPRNMTRPNPQGMARAVYLPKPNALMTPPISSYFDFQNLS